MSDPARKRADAACVQPSAEVVAFIPRKRPRGRPKKPPLDQRPCQDSFDVVAAGVIGIVSQKRIWPRAKERVRRQADRDAGICSAAPKVLGYLLQHINRREGFDWHSATTIARELGTSVRTVERAFRDLGLAGYILREPVSEGGTRASKPWRTTLPALVAAGHAIRGEKASQGAHNKTAKDPTEKGEGPDIKCTEGPDFNVGQTLREETIAPLPPTGGPSEPVQVLEAFKAYNDMALRCGLPEADTLTKHRQRKIAARLREYGSEGWRRAMGNVEKSRFLSGGGDRGWRADLDFLCKPEKFSRLHDGGYGYSRGITSRSVDPEAERAFAASLELARRADEEVLRCPP